MRVDVPEPVVEFLTWNAKRVAREPNVFDWIVIGFALVCVVWFVIMTLAKLVEWTLKKFFSVYESELNLIDDKIWLEEHPICWRCQKDGLFILEEYTIRENGRITEPACRKHFLNPDFRYQVKTVTVGRTK